MLSLLGRRLSVCNGHRKLLSISTVVGQEQKLTVELPKQARVVVIGGGVIGSSTAYHFGKEGWGDDVVVLEQHQLTAGTTWHAAGLIETFGSTSETSTSFRKYTRDLYARLEEETGVSTGWKQCGFIELASNAHRVEEFRRVSNHCRYHGIDVHEISPREVSQLFPLCRVDDIQCGFYVPQDGRANPVDVTMSLAKGARNQGVRFFTGVQVTDVDVTEDGRVCGVRTSDGQLIRCEYVVNCAGMWARQLGQRHGVNIPNQAAEHYYLITEAIPEVDPSWPVIEDPSSYTYIRPEGQGLMVGLFEPKAAAWNVGGIPDSFSFGSIDPDWDRMSGFLNTAMERVPRTLTAGIKTFFCGPESFAPDLSPILGESPELRNYFVAAGLNSIGILTGGGVGRLMAHWVVHGQPDMDVTGVHIDRLYPYQNTPEYRRSRTAESLGMVYKCHYPSHDLITARNAKQTALHDRLAQRGAYFRDISGWESPGWFATDGRTTGVDESSRTGYWELTENWMPFWQKEHEACRSTVTLTDMSFMSKFAVNGRDAGRVLNRLSTANVDEEPGKITYTQWLNVDGGVEADLTVIKLPTVNYTGMHAGGYMVVAADTVNRHVGTMIQRQIEEDANTHAFVSDVTGAWAQINLQGPLSRKLLQSLTDEDVGDEAFPFRTARYIPIGYAWVLCVRITYVGELGYELYVPSEQAAHVYDRIVAADATNGTGMVHAGLRALNSLRLEKGYRSYGHDVDNTDHIATVGLGFTCDMKKPDGFVGKEAVQRERTAPQLNHRRLVHVLLRDSRTLLCHAETLYRNGQAVGNIRAGSYGFSLGGAIALGMAEAPKGTPFNQKFIEEGNWEVDVANVRYPATVSLKPLYDPENKKIRC